MTLAINGAAPSAPSLIFREVRSNAPSKGRAALAAAPSLALASWRRVPHWNVPPAFENSGKALTDLGPELYKEAVREYYASICANGVNRAQRTHSKWAVRQVLRTFETHVRGYRRQDVGRRGGVFHTASDELIRPETLWSDGQLVADLKGIIARYQVAGNLREATERLARQKLKLLWGLK
jgi:hypothetical protein